MYEVVDWFLMNLDYQAQNTTDETELTEIEQMRQTVAYLVEEYAPYVATDKYGNYYNFYNTGGLNYQNEPYYGDWADDYLWLPSASEIAPKEMGAKSIWESVSYMVANQATEIDATLGLNCSNNTLLRSASGYGAVAFHEDGTDFVFDRNENKYALRPAFNLNLTKIIKEFGLEETKSRFVRVDEIWDEQNQDFNKNNLSQLYNYVAGQEMSDLNTISAVLDASENGVLSAKDIRANEVGKKGAGKDIIVKIGGYDWYVTYLSKSKNDEPVLTLWQTNSFQAKNTYNKTLFFGPFTAYMAGSIFSVADSDMYSETPLRIFALNNKESFYIGSQEEIPTGSSFVVDENGYYNYVPRIDNPFSLFTVEELGFTQYLTTPRNIAWQEFQNGSEILNFTCFSNDSWSDEIVDGENGYEFGLSTNYAGEENNSAWADDYLWLPSFTEVCFYENYDYDIDEIVNYSIYGLWQITGEQFKNYNGKDTSSPAFATDFSYPTSYLFRSGANQMQNSSGSVVPGLLSITADGQIVTAEAEGALRPAMHLNLASLPSLLVSGLNIISSRSVYSGSSKLENIDFAFDGADLTHNTDYTFEVF
ncbi:MAG: hypothetical protein IJW36_03090, partial [Clostridia bacterium]|nr:hypothetical protein [Clostridia bacterium]